MRSSVRPALLLGLLGRDGLVHRVVDTENLRQPGDPQDLEYALLRADEIQGAVVRPHSLQRADQHSETGEVQEHDRLHVDDELVIVLVDEIDEQLTEPRRRVDVDLALDVDDLDAVLVVVTQLQVHKSSSAMKGVILTSRPGCGAQGVLHCGIQPRSDVMSIRNHASEHPPTSDTLRKLWPSPSLSPRRIRLPRPLLPRFRRGETGPW